MPLQRLLERMIYASRWLLAPVYLGTGLALIGLTVKFFQELGHLFVHLLSTPENELILLLLSLIDMLLVGGLVVTVMISSYENTVSRLDIDENTEKLSWLGKLDTGSLKLKLAASIVAISSINLLEIFMRVENTPNEKVTMAILLHLTFLTSAIVLVMVDRFSKHGTTQDGGHEADD